ncbi:uncharacterized protein DSM5745_10290 [Aspergillus mulundensis]|uniref:Uncharacterized protein n=1 Tax=Aspergillus mulundensis TaxID=1810919 RepID=A0A3D8QN18_9EURO|nr:hypothetical protein DSM5745_10290 [Aspergillus mulundensis]RDW63179.1 hypothetical protein DSM5745_10290 [Aspergillus mulundensis]
MHPSLNKAYRDIVRLHDQETTLTTLTAARNLGVNIRIVEQPQSLSSISSSSFKQPVPFNPCFFLPPKAKAPASSTSKPRTTRIPELIRGRSEKPMHECVTCASKSCEPGGSSSPATSTSPFLSRQRCLQSSSTSSSGSGVRSSCSSSLVSRTLDGDGDSLSSSSSCSGSSGDGIESEGGPMVKTLAEMKGFSVPKLPTLGKRPVLTANGPVMKGKYRQDQAVALHEDDKWKIIQVLEDTSYTWPHAIIEMIVNSRGLLDGSVLTASEVRAILRVMKLRMELSQYQHHPCLPVLALSYVATGHGPNIEYRSGRIIQAHHDGEQLVIQYSQRHDLYTAQGAPVSLDKFLRYYFSEPVKTGALGGEEDVGESWKLLQWNMGTKRRRDSSDGDDIPTDEDKEDRSFRRWFSKRLVL